MLAECFEVIAQLPIAELFGDVLRTIERSSLVGIEWQNSCESSKLVPFIDPRHSAQVRHIPH
jgi:hypothetical protein